MIEVLLAIFIVIQTLINVINHRKIKRLVLALRLTNGVLNETREEVAKNRKAIRELGKFLDKRGP